ncbi:hypothetical protein ACFYOF_17000 [Streptomyces sp. NPDC007148]|uniref:hypothetical protein n=1 Tax=Streptomyces sp. NPDC007148 TaxID=3364775 RepID=UPI0036942791
MGSRGHKRELPEGFEEFRKNGVRRCWARTKKSGGTKQCPNPAMQGQNICQVHGGKAPQNLAKAKERMTETRARALVETYGRRIDTTATEALLEEVQWTAGHVAWLRERVQEIESDARVEGTDREHPLVWGVTKEKSGGEDYGTTEEAVPSVWLRLYQQERDHLVKVCSAAIKAGIEERRIQLAEQQGALVAQAIRAILGDLQLTPEQQARVPEVVPRHLRSLAGA